MKILEAIEKAAKILKEIPNALFFDKSILEQPTPQWMKDIGYIKFEVTIKKGEIE